MMMTNRAGQGKQQKGLFIYRPVLKEENHIAKTGTKNLETLKSAYKSTKHN